VPCSLIWGGKSLPVCPRRAHLAGWGCFGHANLCIHGTKCLSCKSKKEERGGGKKRLLGRQARSYRVLLQNSARGGQKRNHSCGSYRIPGSDPRRRHPGPAPWELVQSGKLQHRARKARELRFFPKGDLAEQTNYGRLGDHRRSAAFCKGKTLPEVHFWP